METIAKLVIKRTASAAAAPDVNFVEHGELAINYTDGKLYYRDNLNAIQVIGIKNPMSRYGNQTIYGDNIFSGTNTFTAANTFSAANLFSNSNTFSSTNTFSNNNTFSGSNTFSAANTFSGANSFSGVNTFSNLVNIKAVAMTAQTLTDGAMTWNALLGNLATVTLTENSTLDSITNVAPGSYVLRVTQDGTGGHTLEFGTNFKSASGAVVTISPDPDAISILTILNSGGSDLYVINQNDFLPFTITPPPGGGTPLNFVVSGITPTTPVNLNGTYERVADINGLPAWELIIDPLNRVLVSADGDGYYLTEIQDRPTDSDPWVTVGTPHYEIITMNADPFTDTWVETGVTYTGSLTPTDNSPAPSYIATNVATSDVIYLYPKDDAVWYSDPVTPGAAFVGVDGSSKLLLTAPPNGTGSYWELGILATNGIGEFISYQYHVDLVTTSSAVGPLGGYGSIVAPGTAPNYDNPTIGAANYIVTAV